MVRTFKILLFSFCLSCGSALAAEPLKICWESELKPPYLELGENGRVSGAMVYRLAKILDDANIPFEHILLPWSRCLQGAQSGSIDIVPNASYKSRRADFALYSTPAYTSELVLYYTLEQFPSPPLITDMKALSTYRVGGIQGFNYSFYKQQVSVRPKVKQRSQLIDMLQRRRIDFAVMQRNVVEELVKRKEFNLRGISHIPDPVKPQKEYHILVSKKSANAQQLLKVIDAGLAASQNTAMRRQ